MASRSSGCDVLAPAGTLNVAFADLPANAGAIATALDGREPRGSTPMVRAMEAATMAVAARRQASPGRRAAMILATDGYPSCDDGNIDAVVARVQQAFAGPPAVPAYVIGVFSEQQVAEARAIFQRLADAGGTRMPVLLTTNDDLTRNLLAALNDIRAKVVACDYGIPQPRMPLDLERINVSATSQGAPIELSRVSGPDACAGRPGWYFDAPPVDPMNPPRVVLCPDSCTRVQSDPMAHVELVFGCATRAIK